MYQSLISREFGVAEARLWYQARERSVARVRLSTAAALFSRLLSFAAVHPRKRRQVVALNPGRSGPIPTKAVA